MMVLAAAVLVMLLGFCGVTFDFGLMELNKIQMQNAADAAAIGAAYALANGTMAPDWQAAGQADAALNGFTDGVNTVSVTFQTPPGSGPYAQNQYAVQATISQTFNPLFIPVSAGSSTNTVLTATSTAYVPPKTCVYLLSQSVAQPTMNAINESITGSCAVYLGSSYYLNGGSTSIGPQFLVAGSSGNSSGNVSPSAAFNVPSTADPLSYVAAPSLGSCTYTARSVTKTATLSPGTYCGGLTIGQPQPSAAIQVSLRPGTYVITGNLVINNVNLTGSGVTIYMTQGGGSGYGTASISNANVVLSAPTSGNYQGIVYFTDRNMPAAAQQLTLQNWNPSSTVDGILYMLNQELFCSNLPLSGKNYFGIVASYMWLNNTGLSPAANYTSLANGNPFRPTGQGLVQ